MLLWPVKTLFSVMLAILASASLSCGGSSETAADTITSMSTVTQARTSTLPTEQILAKRGNAVFSSILGESSSTPGNLITVEQLYAILQNPAEAEKIFILDTRPRNEWDEQGHIEGAVWIQMQKVADPENLERLPKDKMIICVSPTGHTAVQVASVLRWLGYNAIVLKHGMTGWTLTPAAELMVSDVKGGIAKRYPVFMEEADTLAVIQEPTQELSQPPDDEIPVLTDAAQKLLHEDVIEKEYPFNHIFADDLYVRISDPAQMDSIFLLDIRPLEARKRDGHIEMGTHMLFDWRVLGEPENLAYLPRDKLIVVIGATGQTAGQVTVVLRMMGYDAVTLRSGMTAWTETPDSQDTLTTINSADYPVIKETG